MLEVMYGAGLRLSELVGMNCKHVDLASGDVWVMGKGSKERKVPLGKTAVTWLQHWLALRELFEPQDDAIFWPIPASVFQPVMCRSALPNGGEAGVSSHIHPHKLRHSLPRTCWNPVVIYAQYKSYWAMPT